MGTPEFSVPILESLHQSTHQIVEVYTQPPTKKNRGQHVHLSPVHTFSKENNIPVRYPNRIDTNEELKYIDKLLRISRDLEKNNIEISYIYSQLKKEENNYEKK